MSRAHGSRAHTAKPGVWLVYVRITNPLTSEWSDEPLSEEESEEAASQLVRALDEGAVDVPKVAGLLAHEDALFSELGKGAVGTDAGMVQMGDTDDQQVYSDGAPAGG